MAQRSSQTQTLSSPEKPITREFSAGGIVYRKTHTSDPDYKERIQWLITKSNPSSLYPVSIWRLPKGWIDDADGNNRPGPYASGTIKAPEDEIQKAALREVEEEAGVKAQIIRKIGSERYFFTLKKSKILKFVTFYLMGYISDLPQGFGVETSETAWLSYEDARKILKNSGEKKMLDKANALLESGLQASLV